MVSSQYGRQALDGKLTIATCAFHPISQDVLVFCRLASLVLTLGFLALISYSCISEGTPLNSDLLKAPWMITTLFDFYGLVLFLWLYVWIVHSSLATRILWCLAFACGGSIGMWAFVFWRFAQAHSGQTLADIFLAAQ